MTAEREEASRRTGKMGESKEEYADRVLAIVYLDGLILSPLLYLSALFSPS
ncbi:hypothetical protein C1H46_010767 [Malus baccata]|uniref:Uncharacterized protein n=1 Tax=Malus baccata TaxID=106549 RepID=A0A540MXX0_MALBA|nr:hypothetical protein C1H46_010767 [Malus baccata]